MSAAPASGRSAASTKDGVVEFYVFTSPDCENCEFLLPQLDGLVAQYGNRVKYSMVDVSKFDNLRDMINLEATYGRDEMDIPQVYIGTDAAIGPAEVEAQLPALVARYLPTGSDLPEIPGPETTGPSGVEKTVYIAYFYDDNCRNCDPIALELSYLEKYGSQVVVKRYNLSTTAGAKMNEAMCEAYNIPQDQRGIAPALFVGSDYLVGNELNRSALNAAITSNRTRLAPMIPWEAAETQIENAQKSIEDRFRTLGLPTVLGAGLIDGLNPCAFTVLVFLISYLAFVGKRKGEVLAIGGAFTATVYVTYTLIGIGLFSFIRAIGPSGTAGRWLTGIVAGLTVAFGLLAITDYFRARKTGRAGPSIGMGGNATRRVHEAIRKHTRPAYLLAGAVVLGFLVTVMELGCTGQVYLPTITFVARAGDDRLRAVVYLLVYNLMFVLPLVVVFLLAYFGTSQEKLVDFGRKHSATLELVGGLALVGLSVLLFVTL